MRWEYKSGERQLIFILLLLWQNSVCVCAMRRKSLCDDRLQLAHFAVAMNSHWLCNAFAASAATETVSICTHKLLTLKMNGSLFAAATN